MLIVLQFPFADVRSFSAENNRLSNPTWPSPQVGQYLRSAGQVKRRHLGGLNTWIGESKICDASNAVKFSRQKSDFFVGNTMSFEPCFRRFFFDGQVAGKFEMGFQVRFRTNGNPPGCEDFERLLEKLFLHPIKVSSLSGDRTVPLISAGPSLATRYYMSSSPRSAPADASGSVQNLVKSGPPLLFVETESAGLISSRFWTKSISGLDAKQVALSHFYLKDTQANVREIRCWVMVPRVRKSEYARELRVSLLRLNACRVGLQILVDSLLKKAIMPAPWSEESQRLQYYLDNIVERYLNVPAAYKQSGLLQAAYEAENGISRSDVDILIDTLRMEVNVRRQLLTKTRRNIESIADFPAHDAIFIQELNMGDNVRGDKYEAGQAAAQGPNATAYGNTFNQVWQQTKGSVDLNMLEQDLKKLKAEMLASASEPEHYAEISAIASAEKEAAKGDGEKSYEWLAKAGKWSLEVAEKIGVGVAVAALKPLLGL